jgi:hypothetical protein
MCVEGVVVVEEGVRELIEERVKECADVENDESH